MCGIAGFHGRFGESALRDACDCMAHRGPDAHAVWMTDGVGFAHRRLSIIDLSPLGAQPMHGGDGAVTITYNGEIYNYRALRAELEARGVRFRGHSDTEVLLALYLADGERMLRRLNGIFALAIWDRRDGSMLVTRDGTGIKPLYYALNENGFAFASEIKALLRLVPDARELDPVALYRYLTFLYCPGEGTPLKDVRKLGPGEALRVKDGRIARRWTWYELPVREVRAPRVGYAEALAGTVKHLRTAVHRQLVADVPVGSFLSGGLDSSAIVTFAREVTPDLNCFTIETTGQDAGTTDDLPYARRVASHLGVNLDVVKVDASAMAQDLEGMFWQLDEPLADPAALNVLYICRLARSKGMKVLLSGAGGDDLFSGYRRHVAAKYDALWRVLPGGIRRALDAGASRLDQGTAIGRRAAKLFSGASLEGNAHIAHYFRWNREADVLPLLAPDFRQAATSEAVDQPLLDFLAPLEASVGRLDRMLALEQRFFLADHNLIYTDKMSMAAGVEVRVPFLDTDLMAFADRIPEDLKQHGREGKWIFKKAMEPFLPADVIYRPKSGFGAPLRQWMKRELKPLVADELSEASLRRRGIFDPAAVQDLIRRNDAGRVDGAYALLAVLGIEIWCRRFLDGGESIEHTPCDDAAALDAPAAVVNK
jgi:asparagine synthase (glutamine-hydrolysing)